MYNMLFGVNRVFPILLKALNLSYHGDKLKIEGEYDPGRFRDIYLSGEGDKITLFTRNGGGNREDYTEVIQKLQSHPLYIKNYDDDFDPTYAYFEFSVPDSLQEILDKLMEAQGGPPIGVSEKFSNLMAEMQSMMREQFEADPRFKPLVNIVKQITEDVKP
jgi:hypothetical protein